METPIRRQYLELKRRYPHAILFFRLGDFYETFDDDALVVSRELEIVLTSREMGRGQRVPLAGIPHQSLETHLARLIKRGYKVAVSEQMADPATTKGLVPRDVVRVATPGTVVESNLLNGNENNYLTALVQQRGQAGIAYADVSTGEFCCTQFGGAEVRSVIAAELRRLRPAELLVPADQAETEVEGANDEDGTDPGLLAGQHLSVEANWLFAEGDARLALQEQFAVASLEGFGCARLPLAIRAAGSLIQYLRQNQKAALAHLQVLTTYQVEQFMQLDEATTRSLEIWSGGRRSESHGSLLAALDETMTSMGARLLRRRLGQPLLELPPLLARQAKVSALRDGDDLRRRLRAGLSKLPDFERLAGRLTTRTVSPRELGSLRTGLAALPDLAALVATAPAAIAAATLPNLSAEHTLLQHALLDDPPAALGASRAIRPGFAPQLDDIEASAQEAKAWVAALEGRERARTGIRTLKVGFNKVFGYYLEVSNANRADLPADYQRKQTLAGAERYVTGDLKERETVILNAEERFQHTERAIYGQVIAELAGSTVRLIAAAATLADLDVAAGLAEAAARHSWVQPQLDESTRLIVREGRHPVVEAALPSGEFVPNDLDLDADGAQVLLITGPNMAGKSTYLRQAALITLMAQVGSAVPAASAVVGLTDRIFTRVGAQDDLTLGQSTFMVEMLELANILNHAGRRSLVVLDEIGRGTSTYDGLAIARAAVEHLHNAPTLGCRTLFATHYHELIDLARILPRVHNYNVAVDEDGERVIFLHKIVPGGADRSYGIHVARLAGVPKAVTRRAEELLTELEKGRVGKGYGRNGRATRQLRESLQPSLFGEADGLHQEITALDVLAMTPMEALNQLFALQRKALGFTAPHSGPSE
ncbi:MAG: DNA mismatch repair protein MutS [Chloroflexota bacterium]